MILSSHTKENEYLINNFKQLLNNMEYEECFNILVNQIEHGFSPTYLLITYWVFPYIFNEKNITLKNLNEKTFKHMTLINNYLFPYLKKEKKEEEIQRVKGTILYFKKIINLVIEKQEILNLISSQYNIMDVYKVLNNDIYEDIYLNYKENEKKFSYPELIPYYAKKQSHINFLESTSYSTPIIEVKNAIFKTIDNILDNFHINKNKSNNNFKNLNDLINNLIKVNTDLLTLEKSYNYILIGNFYQIIKQSKNCFKVEPYKNNNNDKNHILSVFDINRLNYLIKRQNYYLKNNIEKTSTKIIKEKSKSKKELFNQNYIKQIYEKTDYQYNEALYTFENHYKLSISDIYIKINDFNFNAMDLINLYKALKSIAIYFRRYFINNTNAILQLKKRKLVYLLSSILQKNIKEIKELLLLTLYKDENIKHYPVIEYENSYLIFHAILNDFDFLAMIENLCLCSQHKNANYQVYFYLENKKTDISEVGLYYEDKIREELKKIIPTYPFNFKRKMNKKEVEIDIINNYEDIMIVNQVKCVFEPYVDIYNIYKRSETISYGRNQLVENLKLLNDYMKEVITKINEHLTLPKKPEKILFNVISNHSLFSSLNNQISDKYNAVFFDIDTFMNMMKLNDIEIYHVYKKENSVIFSFNHNVDKKTIFLNEYAFSSYTDIKFAGSILYELNNDREDISFITREYTYIGAIDKYIDVIKNNNYKPYINLKTNKKSYN